MTLTETQKRKIAGLLGNFSGPTSRCVLSRFDDHTRREILALLEQSGDERKAESQELLKSFAEFLYFDPTPRNRRLTAWPTPTSAIEFTSIFEFDDASLDTLLRMAPPELTVAALQCSPQSFVRRVLGRLRDDEAEAVADQVNSAAQIEIDQMIEIQAKYCLCVSKLIADGLIQLSQRANSG